MAVGCMSNKDTQQIWRIIFGMLQKCCTIPKEQAERAGQFLKSITEEDTIELEANTEGMFCNDSLAFKTWDSGADAQRICVPCFHMVHLFVDETCQQSPVYF
uniref:Uncharacterized protein n=1 Tax=Arundo donax TaxID=35708 RepID=A0A0A9FIY8_ARUDO